MSLSAPRIVFGVHSLSPYSRSTKLPYGILKVIGSASLALTSSVDKLFGGASRFAWAAESKTIETGFSAKVKAYPGFLFQLWLGASVTDNAGEALGSVTTLTNFKGTSLKSATTGVATVTVKSSSEGDLKFGKYVVVAASATTVNVYCMSDVDMGRGTTESYQDDNLKITASALTIVASTGVDVPGFGLTLTGGSGTIGMTTGDTATFSVRPENSKSSDIIVGNALTSLPAFGAVILAQKRATAEMFEIEAFNCIGYGMPIPMAEMAFSETDLKVECLYDSVQDAVFNIRTVTPLSFN